MYKSRLCASSPPPASLDELEKRVALLMAAQQELKRRQREPIVDVTPKR